MSYHLCWLISKTRKMGYLIQLTTSPPVCVTAALSSPPYHDIISPPITFRCLILVTPSKTLRKHHSLGPDEQHLQPQYVPPLSSLTFISARNSFIYSDTCSLELPIWGWSRQKNLHLLHSYTLKPLQSPIPSVSQVFLSPHLVRGHSS